jgi:hypothetical protein
MHTGHNKEEIIKTTCINDDKCFNQQSKKNEIVKTLRIEDDDLFNQPSKTENISNNNKDNNNDNNNDTVRIFFDYICICLYIIIIIMFGIILSPLDCIIYFGFSLLYAFIFMVVSKYCIKTDTDSDILCKGFLLVILKLSLHFYHQLQ